MTEHLYNFVLQKNASIQTSLLDSLHPKLRLGREWLTEPPPTFPFLKSQCQTARRTTNLTSDFNDCTASQQQPRSSVGAGYRSEVRPSQTLKSPKKRFFSGACGRPLRRQSLDKARLYVGGGLPSATNGLHSIFAVSDCSTLTMLHRAIPGPQMKGFRRLPAIQLCGPDAHLATFGRGSAGAPPYKSLKYVCFLCDPGAIPWAKEKARDGGSRALFRVPTTI